MDDRDLLRYSRHILLDEIGIEGQQKITAARIFVLGCGGLGAAALPVLAAAGVGTLTIADGDTVDETNLQRQTAFTENDLGRNKAQAMAGRLKNINSRCTVNVLPERLDEATIAAALQTADLALDCSDNYAARSALNRACAAARKPLVSGAAVRFDGQLAVYRADLPNTPCYTCLFDTPPEQESCALLGVFAPLVHIIGAAQAAEALKIIADIGTPQQSRLKTYNALSGEWQTFEIPKNPACGVCAENN
ncbi:MAG: HesA/MoeB/ThiF family protein [Neisseria animaloris]|nr:HesA/MoeB/ThiF family protein [Neisseria animaloris]